MTEQEINQLATQVVLDLDGDEYWIDKDSSIASVAAAIKAAVAAERERFIRIIVAAGLVSSPLVARALLDQFPDTN